jgi:hypothetical protein
MSLTRHHYRDAFMEEPPWYTVTIVTRNTKDFEGFPNIPVLNP